MSRSRRISLSIILLGFVMVIFLAVGKVNLGTSVVNVGNKEYYEDKDGNLWINRKNYENYDDNSYYVAPDGSYWVNEYRYLESQR